MKRQTILFALFLLIAFVNQAKADREKDKSDKKTTGITYSGKLNQTRVAFNPYGYINMPGKWDKVDVDSRSAFYFTNSDSLKISISKAPLLGNIDVKTENCNEFVKKFYQLQEEKSKVSGLTSTILRSDNDYIIWHITGPGVDEIHLTGAKKEFSFNFTAYYSRFVNDEDRVHMLLDLYLNN